MTREEREELGVETEEEEKELHIRHILDKNLAAITMEQLKRATKGDEELKKIVEEKKEGKKSKESSKGPYGKMWDQIEERDGVLMKDKKLIVPKALQRRAIEIAHEGHMQADGTLRQLRESQWFRGMTVKVKEFVDACKGCATSNPYNPTPPMKLKPLPQIPWWIVAVDFKGPIGPSKWYLHTVMDTYSKYPEVSMVKSTGMRNIVKSMNTNMRTHGSPYEIWSDGGPPYKGKEWTKWVTDWGSTPKRTTPRHPPANGMVERFNRNLKKVIHAAYTERKDPEEEVQKYVAAYRNTPHSTTGIKPSKLMFGRDVVTKLPRLIKKPRGIHHKNARESETVAKHNMKRWFDRKKRTRLVQFEVGDLAYARRDHTSTTKGPWHPDPYRLVKISGNRITGKRKGRALTRDRKDWKKVKELPDDPTTEHHEGGEDQEDEMTAVPPEYDDDYKEEENEEAKQRATAPRTRAQARRAAQPDNDPEPVPPAEQEQAPEPLVEPEQQPRVITPVTSPDDRVPSMMRPSPRATVYKPKYKGCPQCWTVIILVEGAKTCMHRLQDAGYRQDRARFHGPNGELEIAKEYRIPTWMFPNTRRTIDQDSVDTEIMGPILQFLKRLYSPVDPTIDETNAENSDTEGGSSDHDEDENSQPRPTDQEEDDPRPGFEDFNLFRSLMRQKEGTYVPSVRPRPNFEDFREYQEKKKQKELEKEQREREGEERGRQGREEEEPTDAEKQLPRTPPTPPAPPSSPLQQPLALRSGHQRLEVPQARRRGRGRGRNPGGAAQETQADQKQ